MADADLVLAEIDKELEKQLEAMTAEILVGFPSGRMHIDTTHEVQRRKDGSPRVDSYGNKKRKTGGKITQETAELAKELHFGSSRTPARPFLTDGLNFGKEEILERLKQELSKSNPNWRSVGTAAVGAIQKFVRGDYYKTHIPNSPTTIETKGSDKPLIDGADLINSLTFLVNGTEDEAQAKRVEESQKKLAEKYSLDIYGD